MKADHKPPLIKKHTDKKHQKVDESIVPSLEDESTEVKHVVTEPKSEHVSVDEVLCFDKENLEKHLKMEDFACAFDYGWKINRGELDSTHGLGDDLNLEVLDGFLDEIDEVDDIHAAHDLSSACEDFLLDIEFPKKISELDCGPQQGSNLLNSNSESHSTGFTVSSNGADGTSESSIATVQESNYKNDGLVKSVSGDLPQAPVMDGVRSSRHNLDESDDEKPLVSFILSNMKGKGSVKVAKGSTLFKQNRLRKPTRRYIEGSNRNSKTREHKRLKLKSQELAEIVPESRPRRGRPKKIVPELELESNHDLSSSESEYTPKRIKKSKTACGSRKHQKMWSPAEVIKLVDGIAEFGVGRWTDIKRHLFASSAKRTPVDLRDKWRNLLKSLSAVKYNRRKSENNLKKSVRKLPKPLVLRIHELATVHPYPRVPGSKFPSVDVPEHLATAKDASVNPKAKNLRRKKFS